MFKKGDYIVYLGIDRKGKSKYHDDISINYIFKFIDYQSGSHISKTYILGEWLNENTHSGPPASDFRLATPQEIEGYKILSKPFNVSELPNNNYEIY